MPTNIQNVVDRARANHHDLNEDVAERLVRRKCEHVSLIADAAAGTTVTDLQLITVPAHYPDGVKVVSVKIMPQSTVTANDTNYATITLKAKTAAGATVGTNVCTFTTKITGGSGDMTALVAYAPTMTTTEADKVIPVGGSLAYTQAKAVGGVQLPIITIEVVYDVL